MSATINNIQDFIGFAQRLIEYVPEDDSCRIQDPKEHRLLTPEFVKKLIQYISESLTQQKIDTAMRSIKIILTFPMVSEDDYETVRMNSLHEYLTTNSTSMLANPGEYILQNWDEHNLGYLFGYESDAEGMWDKFSKWLGNDCSIRISSGGQSNEDIASEILKNLQNRDGFIKMCDLWGGTNVCRKIDNVAFIELSNYNLTSEPFVAISTKDQEGERANIFRQDNITKSPKPRSFMDGVEVDGEPLTVKSWSLSDEITNRLHVFWEATDGKKTFIHWNAEHGWVRSLDLAIYSCILTQFMIWASDSRTWEKTKQTLIDHTRSAHPEISDGFWNKILSIGEGVDSFKIDDAALKNELTDLLKGIIESPGRMDETVAGYDFFNTALEDCKSFVDAMCAGSFDGSDKGKWCEKSKELEEQITITIQEIENLMNTNTSVVFKNTALNIINEISIGMTTSLPGRSLAMTTAVGHQSQSGGGRSTTSSGGAKKKSAPTGNCSIKAGVDTRNGIDDAWGWICKFLPPGSQLSSGFRDAAKQKEIIKNEAIVKELKDAAGVDIKKGATYSDTQYKTWVKQLDGKGFKVAAPGESDHEGNSSRQAFDVSGGDASKVREIDKVIRKLGGNSQIKFTLIDTIIEIDDPRQMVVHVVFKPSSTQSPDDKTIEDELAKRP